MTQRIPKHVIEEVISRTDIVDVISPYVALKKAGKNYKGLCPFHQEKTPSFTVFPHQQTYYCFGCGASGTAINFVMTHNHLSFAESVRELAGRVGVSIAYDSEGETSSRPQQQALFDLMQQVTAFYQAQLQLPAAQSALNYLQKRRLNLKNLSHFSVGYAPNQWDALLTSFGDNPIQRQQLVQLGLVIEKENGHQYDRFRHRIMFPIYDLRGRVIAFGGRVVDEGSPKYLNSPESELFEKNQVLYGWYQARQSKSLNQVLIVEGYMDVLALVEHGFPNTVATLGTTTSQTHLAQIFRSVSEIVFCFDGDKAGIQAARRAVKTALPNLRDNQQIRFAFLPKDQDPDTFIRHQGSSAFQTLLDQALLLSEFLFSLEFLYDADKAIDLNTVEGQAQYQHQLRTEILPLVESLPKGAYRRQFYQHLKKILPFLRQEDVNFKKPATLSKGKVTKSSPTETNPQSEALPKVYSLWEKGVWILVQHPHLAKDLPAISQLKQQSELAELLVTLIHFIHQKPQVNTAIILEQWRGTQVENLLNYYASQPYPLQAQSISMKATALTEEQQQAELNAIIETLFQQQRETEINRDIEKLIQKDRQSSLTAEEKYCLKALYALKFNQQTQVMLVHQTIEKLLEKDQQAGLTSEERSVLNILNRVKFQQHSPDSSIN